MDKLILTNFDLKYYCNKLNINLIDIVYKDMLNTMNVVKGCYIINLEDSSDFGNGSHWVCFILDTNKKLYFDSYGIIPSDDIIQFMNRYKNNIPIVYNIDQIQDIDSVLCGFFCLYFIYYITILNKYKTNYKLLMNKHNKIYTLDNKKNNDIILQKKISKIKGKILNN